MKRLLPVLLFACFALVSIGQTVPEIQRSLLTKKTATWCPLCGTWGWAAFEKAIDDNDDKAIMLGAHYSGDLLSSTAQDYMRNLTGSGQPRYYMGTTDLRLSSSNYTSKLNALKTEINDIFVNTAPMANAASHIIDNEDGTISSKTKTTFFQDADGEFYTVVYLLENNVSNNQSGRGLSDHPFVLRAQMGSETFGELVVDGAISAGTSDDKTFEVKLNPSWNIDNLFFATIVWEKIGDKYQFVNGTLEEDFFVSTAQNDLSGLSEFVIAPNIMTEQSRVTIKVDQAISGSVKIYDLLGHEVLNLFSGTLQEENRFSLSRDQFSDTGMYIITAQIGNMFYNKRIVVK